MRRPFVSHARAVSSLKGPCEPSDDEFLSHGPANGTLGRRQKLPRSRQSHMKRGQSAANPLQRPSGESARTYPLFSIDKRCLDWQPPARQGSPRAFTHRFLHRCYAHGYPQGVRDFSQPVRRSRTGIGRQGHLLHQSAGSPHSVQHAIQRWRPLLAHEKLRAIPQNWPKN